MSNNVGCLLCLFLVLGFVAIVILQFSILSELLRDFFPGLR